MLYENINLLCASENITVTELERILQFGNGTIHNWKEKQARLEKVLEVAQYFNVSVDDLISAKGVPSKEAREIAARISSYTDEQKNLIKCYMSIIENKSA